VFGARMRVNGEELYTRSLQVMVGNGRHYGGGMTIAEDATIDDGVLHVYSIEPVPFLHLVGIAPLLKRDSHARSDAVMLVRTQELELVTDRPVPVNADGELVGTTPARFSVVPGALRVMVPPEYAERRKEILHAAAQRGERGRRAGPPPAPMSGGRICRCGPAGAGAGLAGVWAP
jgi:diacylglycerol kinase (ATP)